MGVIPVYSNYFYSQKDVLSLRLARVEFLSPKVPSNEVLEQNPLVNLQDYIVFKKKIKAFREVV